MNNSRILDFLGVCRVPRQFTLLLGGALALGLGALPGLTPLHGDGEVDEERVERFDEHLDDFEREVRRLAAKTDAIVAAYEKGEAVEGVFKEWIELWEEVEIHGVIETKVVHLYPPVWQGFYGMRRTAEKDGSASAMRTAGERTKAALWQGLGGLRALAELPGKGAAAAEHRHGKHAGGKASDLTPDNRIELTGNDEMRFNKTHFVVRAGEPVTLRFENIGELPKDVMGHNVVVLKRGAEVEPFGLAAGEAADNDYIPTEPKHVENIIAHTEMLGPDGTDTITFTLEKPGEYPFLCSFIAHYQLMRGMIEAVADPETQPIEAILDHLEKAVQSYADGDTKRAESLVHSAYMEIFEGLEGDLIEQDPDLVSQLEIDFNAGLPATFKEDGSPEEARKMLETMRERLQRAKELLSESETDRPDVF